MLNIKEKVEGLSIASRSVKEIQESLSAVLARADSISKNLESLEAKMSSIEGRLSSQEGVLERLSASAEESMKKISEAAMLLNSETAKVSEERKKFSERMLTRVSDELSKEISDRFSRLKEDGEKYRQFTASLSQVSTEVLSAKNELEKFSRIGEKIQASDFEMSALANKIEQMSIRNKQLQNQLDRMQNPVPQKRRHPRLPPY